MNVIALLCAVSFVVGPDCFVPKQHIQGIAASDDALYLSQRSRIVKVDWSGKPLAAVDVVSHTGDLCWYRGELFTAIAREPALKEGVIQVFGSDLELKREMVVDRTLDGIACLDGVLYVGMGAKTQPSRNPHRKNILGRFDVKTLKEILPRVEFDYGHDTKYGFQNICSDGKLLYGSFYAVDGAPSIAVFDSDVKILGTGAESANQGLDFLPTGLAKDDRNFVRAKTRVNGEKVTAEISCLAIPVSAPVRQPPLCDYHPDPSRLHLRDNRVWRPSPSLGTNITVEYVFVPRDLALLPPGKESGYGRSLLNIGSGYYSGLRLVGGTGRFGLFVPNLQIGRPQGSVVCHCKGILVPDATNQLFVVWNGREAKFTLNGRPAGGGKCEACWTPPESNFLGVGFNGYGIDALPQNAVRVRIWNRVLADDEIAAEYIYRNRPVPLAIRLMDNFKALADGVTCEGQTSDELEKLAADAKLPEGTREIYERTLADLRLREGKTQWGVDVTADDDGRPRHHPVPLVPAPGLRIFVSPSGNDGAAGTESAPLRTLLAARNRVREFRARGLPAGGVTVCLRGGTYPVESTLELSQADSGEPDRPVVWTSYNGERAVLDGGFRVLGFTEANSPDVLARLPVVSRGKVLVADVKALGAASLVPQTPYGTGSRGADERIMGLYFNGEPLVLAREPNDGWYTVGECVDATNRVFRPAGIADLSIWTKNREPELMALGYWKYFWADSTTEVDDVDVANGTMCIRDHGNYTEPKKGQVFRFVNALAAIDEPGEWFLDRQSGRLYVYPKGKGGSYVLTRFGDAFVAMKDVHDVRIEKLVFQHGRGRGVTMRNCSSVVFAGNVVRRFGGKGVVAQNLRDVMFAGNVLHTFGHLALAVSSGNRRTLTPAGLVVANNEIWDSGRAQRTYSPGVHASGVGIEIVHNHIHDMPSSAIMPGGNDHYVGWNLVERVVTESDDQGGIDMWGDPTWAGTRMCWNIWRDIGGAGQGGFPAGRAGIRLDDAISGMKIYGNRFINSSKGGFGGVQIHAGRFNRVENNLFVGGACGVSFTNWGQDRWAEYFRRPSTRDWMEKSVNAVAAPFSVRYPHLAMLVSSPMTNDVARNVFAEVGKVFSGMPKDTNLRGNLKFGTMAAAEAAFGREHHLRPLPPMGDVGTYSDPYFDSARRNDSFD